MNHMPSLTNDRQSLEEFGICENPNCSLGIGSIAGIVSWFSGATIPGAGKAEISFNEIPTRYKKGLQSVSARNQHCTECGHELLRESGLPKLGSCPKCKRGYGDEDLARNFCPCGERIEFGDYAIGGVPPPLLEKPTIEQYHNQQLANKLLWWVSSLPRLRHG